MVHHHVSNGLTETLKDQYSMSPSYVDLLIDLEKTIRWYYQNCTYPKPSIYESFQQFHIDLSDVYYVMSIAVLITIIRYLFERIICTRLVNWLELTNVNKKRFPESSWKFIFYTCTWSYGFYLIKYRYNYFDEPYLIWNDWSADMSISFNIKLFYFIQCSFYIHSVYATLYMDSVRKDFYIMIFHHFLTITLVVLSYVLRYHKVGLLVFFLHDIADMWLQLTKLMRYLSSRQNGRQCSGWQQGSYVSILIFTLCWFVSRLYWFPLKVLYTTGVVSIYWSLNKTLHLYILFNIFLWILLGLNIYWFILILQSVYKAIFGRESKWGDVREYDEDKSIQSSNNYSIDKKQK